MNEVAKLETGNGSMLPAAAHGTNTMAAAELFVINLCASMTPMPAVPKNLKGFEKYKLYQVSRQEDGRRRFRLRLGFFTSEADAEWVLNSVRGLYPAAFTGCVNAEDMRYTGDAIPSPTRSAPPAATPAPPTNLVSQPVTPKPSVAAAPAPVKAAPIKANVIKPSAAPAAAATPATNAKPVAAQSAAPAAATANVTNNKPVVAPSAAPAPAKPAALTASTPAPTPQPAADAQSYQPFHVGRGVELPEIDLELTDEHEILSVPKPAPAPIAPQVNQPAAATARNATATASTASRAAPANAPSNGPIRSASIISPPKVVDDYVPILDTTLTIRTLTKTEAEDPNRPKWFAVQLAISEQPINLDTMPKLDIFAAYTLYCVATMEGNTIKHALRLGFFRENVSAEAVMGYLKAFFNQPTINQISTAEFERFSEPKPKAKAAAEPEAKVVNLDAKRPGAPVKPLAPIAAHKPVQQVAKPVSNKPRANTPAAPAPARPQSFLSRLIGRQLD